MLARSIARNALGLALFAAVTVGVIAVTEVATRERIEARRAEARTRALAEILAPAEFDPGLGDDVIPVADPRLGLDDPEPAHVARHDGKPFALLVPVVAPDGYSGPIRLVVGIRHDGVLAGVRVLEHRETPGLGDAIEARKSGWIRAFEGRSLGDPPPERWTVAPEGGAFDAFTGATITPRAVVRAVRRALAWFEQEGRARLARAGAAAANGETRP